MKAESGASLLSAGLGIDQLAPPGSLPSMKRRRSNNVAKARRDIRPTVTEPISVTDSIRKTASKTERQGIFSRDDCRNYDRLSSRISETKQDATDELKDELAKGKKPVFEYPTMNFSGESNAERSGITSGETSTGGWTLFWNKIKNKDPKYVEIKQMLDLRKKGEDMQTQL